MQWTGTTEDRLKELILDTNHGFSELTRWIIDQENKTKELEARLNKLEALNEKDADFTTWLYGTVNMMLDEDKYPTYDRQGLVKSLQSRWDAWFESRYNARNK